MNFISDNPKLIQSLNLKNSKSMEKFGEKVGTQMAFICPEVFLLLKDDNTSKKNEDAPVDKNTVSGEIEAFESEELKYVLIKENDGRINKFLWLRSFEGDADLIKKGNDAVGKKVKIEYTEIEIYSPKLGEYINRKEIKKISF